MWLPLTIWLIICGAGFLYALFGRLPGSSWNTSLILIASVAILARLVPVVLYPEPLGLTGVDIGNYAATARAVLDRRDVYLLPIGTHPYPPLHMYVFAAAQWLADQLDASFFVLVRLPQGAADVGTALLLALIVRDQRSDAEGYRLGLAYALCPLAVFVTVYHGQFDAVSVFFAVLALWAMLRSEGEPVLVTLSAVALALGTMEKMWPVLLLPIMLAALPGMRLTFLYAAVYAAVCAGLTGLYVAAFSSSVTTIVDTIRAYNPVFPTAAGLGLVIERTFGEGAEEFLTWFRENGTFWSAVMALAACALAIVLRLPATRSIVLALAVFLVTTPASESYHVLWIVPFALAVADRIWVAVVVITTTVPYAAAALLGAGMFIPPLDSPVADIVLDRRWWFEYARWLTLVAWVAVMVWGALEAPRERASRRA